MKEGMTERVINLIHSIENRCGKTTLLRFILYSLGYKIPNTKKFKFNHCEIETRIKCETHGNIRLFRYSDDFIEITINGKRQTFALLSQLCELHKELFNTANTDILSNLLGAFYVEQEKGWILLKRGVVIGSIHFNIEKLIRGLSGRDCSALIQEKAFGS